MLLILTLPANTPCWYLKGIPSKDVCWPENAENVPFFFSFIYLKKICLQMYCPTPVVHAGCFSVSIVHQTRTWTTGSLMSAEMVMHVIAHGSVQTP